MRIFSPSTSPASGGSGGQSQQSGLGGPFRRVFSRKNSRQNKKQPQQVRESASAADEESAATSSQNMMTVQISKSSEHFTADQLKKLKTAFDYFDIDNDGRISSGELKKVLNFLGNRVSEAEARLMIAEVDENCNGAVEFNEFIKMMSNYYQKASSADNQQNFYSGQSTPEDIEILEAFQAFDHNGDNYIDFNELKKTMQFLGELVSDSDVNCMIQQADTDMDGRIDLQEFNRLITAMKSRRERK